MHIVRTELSQPRTNAAIGESRLGGNLLAIAGNGRRDLRNGDRFQLLQRVRTATMLDVKDRRKRQRGYQLT